MVANYYLVFGNYFSTKEERLTLCASLLIVDTTVNILITLKDINMARAMETYASDLMPEGSKSYFSPTDQN